MKKFTIMTALLVLSSTTALADDALINSRLKSLGVQEIELKDSPIKGIKTAITEQGILYITDDANYVMQGSLYQLTDKGPVDLGNRLLFDKLKQYESQMIVYPAKNPKHTVTVFMDITCHYCNLLHKQLKEYNDLGITVRYLAFPRGGLNTQTARQMEAIWSAKDPAFALNEAEKGNLPKELKSPDIVKKQYDLGVQYGVRGTPSIVTETGELIGGYLEPKQLLAALEE